MGGGCGQTADTSGVLSYECLSGRDKLAGSQGVLRCPGVKWAVGKALEACGGRTDVTEGSADSHWGRDMSTVTTASLWTPDIQT